ncbi:MmgE/PrpD family protein [Dactylosporangium sp. CA-092794]|uniref:MmgE/PrpD family protein n=1 Tax=Dactylosporangium sp. CA-092794 TaxID=3239929 RepID=UPI003D91222A
MTVLDALTERGLRAAAGDRHARDTAALHLLDTVGCIAGAAGHPTATRLGGLPPAAGPHRTLGGHHSLGRAVLVEATLAHLDEFDALHPAAAVAPAAVVVPTALLVAADVDAPGERLLAAVLAGYETVVEAALRFGGAALYASGWWPTAVFGPLGAAAATAVLLDLSPARHREALSLAAAGLGGLLSADRLGDAHYLLTGQAAARGAEAAYLARAGAGGSPALLDAPAAAALGRAPAAPSPAGPSPAGPSPAAPSPAAPSPAGPHLLGTALKAYPCARPLHAALDALRQLAGDGVDLAAAREVRVALPPPLLRFVTADPAPPGPAEAAASAAVAVAALLRGRADDPAAYRDGGPPTGPPVSLAGDETLLTAFPAHWGAEVTVSTVDGAVLRRRVLDAPGDPARPLDATAVRAKFDRQVPRAARLAEACLGIAAAASVRPLRRLLAGVLR